MRFLLFATWLAACGGACPDTAPSTGDDCDSTAECNYGAQVCSCSVSAWYCRPAACPPRRALGDTCSDGLTCRYGFEDTCYCLGDQWTCVGGVPFDFAVPLDFAARDLSSVDAGRD